MSGTTISDAPTAYRVVRKASHPLLHRAFLLGLLVAAWLHAPGPAAAQEAADTFAIEGLVVTATPVPLPATELGRSVTVLDGDELRQRGIWRVSEALRTAPGISLARNGSYGAVTTLFMRGAESDHVQVLLDGVPINQPGGAVDLAGLTTEAVERIEIVRGPSSALYGSDAVAGVVHIITRSGAGGADEAGPAGSVTLRGGSYGRRDGLLEVRGGDEGASYGISLADYSTDGVLAFNNRHDNTVLNGRAELRPADRLRTRISARLSDRAYHFPTDFTGAVVDRNQSTFSQEATVGMELDGTLRGERGGPGSVGLRALLSLHDQESGTDDDPDGPDDDQGLFGFQSLDAMRRTAADLRATWIPVGPVTVTGGFEVERQRIRSFTESLSEFGSTSDRSENARTNRAGYLHAVLGWEDTDVNLGARTEANGQYGNFVTWQIAASRQIAAGTRIRASAGRGVKEPTFFEAFATGFAVGNPELEPERSTSWDVGLDQQIGTGVRIGGTWFDQSLRDLIQYTAVPPAPDDPSYFNVGAADARGLELVAEADLSVVTVSGEWTRLTTEVVDAGFAEGPGATFVEGEPLLRRPENEWSLSVAGRLGARVRWNGTLRHVGERSDRDFSVFPAEPVLLEPHTVVDAGLAVGVLEGEGGGAFLDVVVTGENLGDRDYEEVLGFRAPGRALTVGARLGWAEGR